MGRPTRAEARDTRNAILSTALDLFAKHGFEGASVRALAAAVGVSESALYHYFPSKEAVLTAVLAHSPAVDLVPAEVELAALADGSLQEICSALLARMAERIAAPDERKRIRLALAVGPDALGDAGSPWHALFRRPRRRLLRLFRGLQESGRVRRDVELEVFVAYLIGPLLIARDPLWAGGKGPLTIPLKRFLRQQAAFVAEALAPPRRRRRRS